MRVQLLFLRSVLFLMTVITSCEEDDVLQPPSITNPPYAPKPAGPVVNGSREYYWGLGWEKTNRGYEIQLKSNRLTQEAITKGIFPAVAIHTEMTTFDVIPLTFYDLIKKDSVHLSYSVSPGKLQVIANAPFEIYYVSDVYIQY